MLDLNNPMQIPKHSATIEYRVPRDCSEHTLMVAKELIRNYQHAIRELVFQPSSGGRFEVKVDNDFIRMEV